MKRKGRNADKTPPPSTQESSTSESEDEAEESFVSSSRSSKGTPRKSQKSSTSKKSKKPNHEPMTPNRIKRFEAEMNALVCDCVYYVLIADQKKHAIRRADIVKHLLKNEYKRQFEKVFLRAKDILKKVYGMQIIELGEKRGHYFMVNVDKQMRIAEFTQKQAEFRGLLLFILTVIFMNENSIREEDLYKALKILEVDCDDTNQHPVFGDVKKYITQDLVKQLYLKYQKVNSEPPEFEFHWGPRADYEVDKEQMLMFVCDVYGNDPEDWIVQHKLIQEEKASQEEEEEAAAAE